VNWTALTIFVLFVCLYHLVRFCCSQRAKAISDLLHEGGSAGLRFGTLLTWFLVAADLYTAILYAVSGTRLWCRRRRVPIAVPLRIVAYPLFFLVFPRIWYVAISTL